MGHYTWGKPCRLTRRRLMTCLAAMAGTAAAAGYLSSAGVAHAATGSPGEERRFLIGFAQDTMANDWRAAQVADVAQALSQHPEVTFISTDAEGDTAVNIRDIDDLVDRGVNLLMVSPRDHQLMAPAIAGVFRRGIPVLLLSRRIESEDYTAFIGPDDRAIGRRAAAVMAEALGGQGRVLMLQGVPTTTTAMDRTKGFYEGLADHPGITVAAAVPANYLRADAILAVEQVLATGIAFDGLYAQNDSMAEGARMALRAAGIDPKSVPTVGIDYIPEARRAIRAGEQYASFTYPTGGPEAARVALDILYHRPFPRQLAVESVLVTRDTVDTVAPVFEETGGR